MERQRFLLKWHRHAATIVEQVPAMFDEGLFTDVTISVEGERLRAHRLILASCSPYFLQIFQEADKTHVEHPFVVLINANAEDIKSILSFMYRGECCVYKHRLSELLATAKHLKVHGLSDMKIGDYVEEEKKDDFPVVLRPHRDATETCKCFACGKYLSNQYNLRVHMETHEETYHACDACPHVSRSRDALRKHMSYRHPDKYSLRKHKKSNAVM